VGRIEPAPALVRKLRAVDRIPGDSTVRSTSFPRYVSAYVVKSGAVIARLLVPIRSHGIGDSQRFPSRFAGFLELAALSS
jgi:hypothetical protein